MKTTTVYTNKDILVNVAIIRPILIVLLVFYHAFAPFSGGWAPIEGFPDVPAYWWMDKLSYFFMLEMFVLVSGYVLGYQVKTKGGSKISAKNVFWGKFKRLMIPSMIFSASYLVLFRDVASLSIGDIIYGIISGTGHMWFLPMLYCCFILLWLFEKIRLSTRLVLPLLFVCAMIPIIVLPLHAGHSVYYMFYFYLGYIVQRREIKLEKAYKPTYAVVLGALFLLLFPVVTMLQTNPETLVGGGKLLIIAKFSSRVLSILGKITGIWLLFVLIGVLGLKAEKPLASWMIKIGGMCMGVYLFQQFILKGLYDFTTLPNTLGPYWLPWAGFIITLVVSLFLTWLMQQSKFGKMIVG